MNESKAALSCLLCVSQSATSKGNYLCNLSIRLESINFHDGISQDQNMDDLILCSALWQVEHFINRQYMLSGIDNVTRDTVPTSSTSKVMLLSFNQNCASIIYVLYFPSILNVTSSLSEGMQSKGCHQREGHGLHYCHKLPYHHMRVYTVHTWVALLATVCR